MAEMKAVRRAARLVGSWAGKTVASLVALKVSKMVDCSVEYLAVSLVENSA